MIDINCGICFNHIKKVPGAAVSQLPMRRLHPVLRKWSSGKEFWDRQILDAAFKEIAVYVPGTRYRGVCNGTAD